MHTLALLTERFIAARTPPYANTMETQSLNSRNTNSEWMRLEHKNSTPIHCGPSLRIVHSTLKDVKKINYNNSILH